MLEVFKIVVLCLICTIFIAFFSTVVLTTALFIVLIALFYDFDFETPFERHAIIKVKHAYLKVRSIYQTVYPSLNQTNQYIYSPIVNKMNKQPTDFDLSRFNRSGSVFSPISRIGGPAGSRRLSTQTSTPLTRTSPWQKNSFTPVKAVTLSNSTLSRSPRYSLSSFIDNSNDVKNNTHSPTVQTVAGPLLASTRFNINLGTYTDTKSPGLASRVVQYHNESQNEAQTHQTRYRSPGQFPIVQLYKKKLPLLTRTPKRCTVRVAPPDCVAYDSQEGNQILRETFVQRNTENNTQNETEINTKSVLDALKEISRKRIHSNDDLEDLSKRQRKSSTNTNTDNTNKDGKRLREDTPPKPKGTSLSPSTKKICVTDEIECSLSSSILMRQKGQKRKAGISGETVANAIKQRKISWDRNHISRETQTPATQTDMQKTPESKSVTHSTQTTFKETKSTNTKQPDQQEYTGLQEILQNARRKKKQYYEKSIEEIDEERSSLHFAEPKPVKPLFSHEPMEIIMKNRLEVAMAALNGGTPEIIPLPNLTLSQMIEKHKKEQDADNLSKEKELTSIISPKNKTKHDKHVSFDIPNNSNTETSKDLEKSSVEPQKEIVLAVTTVSEPKTPEKSPFGVQISFGAVTNTTVSNNTIPTPLVAETLQPSSQFKFGENKIPNTTKAPVFGGLVPPTMPNLNTNTISPAPNTNLSFGSPAISFGAPNLSFGNVTPESKVLSVISTTQSTNAATNTQSFGSNISYGVLTQTSAESSVPVSSISSPFSSNSSFGASQPINFGVSAPKTTAPMFGSAETNTTVLNFGSPALTKTTVSNFGTPTQTGSITFGTPTTSNSGFSFGAKSEGNASISTFNFSGKKPSPKSGGFKFDLGKPASAATEAPKSTSFGDVNKPSTFSFGANNNTNLPAFGTTTVSTTSVFGSATTASAPAFGATTISPNAPSFGVISTTPNNLFGGATTAQSPSTFGAISTTPNTLFGGTTTVQTPPTFGAISTTQSNLFGGNDSKQLSVFGANSTTSAPAFGLPTTTSSVFGSTTTAPAFGAPKPSENKTGFSFGATTTQSSTFGSFTAPVTTGHQNSGFGFGSAPNSTTTAPASTTANTFSFGGSAQNKPFAFNAATTANSVFGGTNAPPTFGAPTQNSGVFGAPTTTSGAVFGAPTTTTQISNVFGNPTTTSNVFGTNTTTTTANTFGQSNSGVFGAPSTKPPAFGAQNTFGNSNASNNFAPPNQAPFGSGSANNVFGGTAPLQSNVFGAPPANKPTFEASKTPTFGSGTFTPTPAFGANATPNNNVFGSNGSQQPFGSTNNNNNNQPSSGGFGPFANNPPSQQGAVFAFGGNPANSSSTNAFQFGGSTTPAKPAGFNFSTNATTPNLSYNIGNPAPAFGATPAFGAPNTGMFNIGSGSTAPKQRPMIKARRRNN